MPTDSSPEIDAHLRGDIQRTVSSALEEDIGSGDLTASLIPADSVSQATIISREPAVLCGSAWLEAVYEQLDRSVQIHWLRRDAEPLEAGQPFCHLTGLARGLLTGERTALNFLQTLSATATLTQQFVQRIEGTKTRILDTRKTLPGLRRAQKYAVRCGGGSNHRMGLFDAILIKENHILAAGSISQAVQQARAQHANITIEVETESLDQVRQALIAGADIIMLDNFDLPAMRLAVEMTNRTAQLEVSGNVSLENVRDIAETGVDFISVGSLTKNIRAIDLSMRFQV